MLSTYELHLWIPEVIRMPISSLTISVSYISWLENGLELKAEGDIEFPGLKRWEGKVKRLKRY